LVVVDALYRADAAAPPACRASPQARQGHAM